MAIFLSKRLLRFAILVAVSLFVIITLNSHNSGSSYVSNFIPSSFQLSSNNGLSASEGFSAEELEEQRLNAAEGKSDLSLDEQAKALQSSANPVTDLNTNDVMEFIRPSFQNKGERPKACYVTLVRNSELKSMLNSIRRVEQRFNKQFKYDWIFLNDEPFTDEFKKAVQAEISSTVKFGLIPTEHWSLPSWIDESRATETRFKMAHIIYGGSESYRHMCRFQSGFFWRHPLLDDYDWYWRVEPDINLYCDIKYDVFQWMQDNEKVYGFTISIHEYLDTIPTLWETSMKFFNEHSEYVADNNLMKFISEDNGATYNLCHFWSNFEIANLNLWRSPAYKAYFDALDKAGGFFYERWGDAPVHSIAASIILPKDRIHYFPNIGYHHPPYDNCPLDNRVYAENNCDCKQDNDFTFKGYSCGNQYYAAQGIEKPPYWEKYSH